MSLDGRLLCNATGMTLKINYTKFISHDRPFEIHFKNTTDHACSVPHNSSENLINDQLQIHATYNTCGIDIFERGDDIVYNQTVLLTYGINPKSDLVYREEVIKFDVECKKMSNLTVYLEALGHINVTELAEQTFTKSKYIKSLFKGLRLQKIFSDIRHFFLYKILLFGE